MSKLKKVFALFISVVIIGSANVMAFAAETDTSYHDKMVVEQLKQEMHAAEQNSAAIDEMDKQLDVLTPKLVEAYNEFSQNRIASHFFASDNNTITAFVDYAAEQGMIEDTAESKNAVTKALVRLSFKAVVTGGNALGYKFAAELLDHSLQDSPSDKSYNRGSTRSNQVQNSSEFKSIVKNIKSQLAKTSKTVWSDTGSTTLNSTTDLFLALNKVSYIAGAEKVNGKWTIYIRFHDTYDFEYKDWMGAPGVSGAMATALNNYGAYANSIGAIVSYDIAIYTSATY
ncbi:hypothetical protein [Thermoanaerobacterium butyriciformans]|uniref:Uncharacterized protein n=1 Tax=Thermoanaerobacterium butyriciformans TaxID=1702242 RepID=A0ABS4NC70_9THEO|nr:hypothetical protein [Thermoanaerobacterium butyriciformans]MBP2070612.1 hypothetical protein [Thermoanaerobacterium butyriciformans]